MSGNCWVGISPRHPGPLCHCECSWSWLSKSAGVLGKTRVPERAGDKPEGGSDSGAWHQRRLGPVVSTGQDAAYNGGENYCPGDFPPLRGKHMRGVTLGSTGDTIHPRGHPRPIYPGRDKAAHSGVRRAGEGLTRVLLVDKATLQPGPGDVANLRAPGVPVMGKDCAGLRASTVRQSRTDSQVRARSLATCTGNVAPWAARCVGARLRCREGAGLRGLRHRATVRVLSAPGWAPGEK